MRTRFSILPMPGGVQDSHPLPWPERLQQPGEGLGDMGIQDKLFRRWSICTTGLAFITFIAGSILLLQLFP